MIFSSVVSKVTSFLLILACASLAAAGGKKEDAPKTVVDVAVMDSQLSSLVGALKAADLVDVLLTPGPFTVFAPKNYPFSQLPGKVVERLMDPKWKAHLQDLLLYHVFVGAKVFSTDLKPYQTIEMANGGEVSIMVEKDGDVIVNKDAKVKEADIKAKNGVIHKISEVLLPDSVKYNIVELGINNPDKFSILVKLVVAAGLDGALSGPGPFTLFAPTNSAFEALGPKVLKSLLKPKNKDTLVAILKYHVVPGIVLSKDVFDGATAPTLEGSEVSAKIKKDMLFIKNAVSDKGAKVVGVDVLANNGVIHVIDDVLIPPSGH